MSLRKSLFTKKPLRFFCKPLHRHNRKIIHSLFLASRLPSTLFYWVIQHQTYSKIFFRSIQKAEKTISNLKIEINLINFFRILFFKKRRDKIASSISHYKHKQIFSRSFRLFKDFSKKQRNKRGVS